MSLFDIKKAPKRSFSCAHGETRTPKGIPNGFWDRNVYQFRHVGRAIVVRMKGLEPYRFILIISVLSS